MFIAFCFLFKIVCNLCGCQGSPRLCIMILLKIFGNIIPEFFSANLVEILPTTHWVSYILWWISSFHLSWCWSKFCCPNFKSQACTVYRYKNAWYPLYQHDLAFKMGRNGAWQINADYFNFFGYVNVACVSVLMCNYSRKQVFELPE